MRALAAGCLVGVALVFTGCGTSKDAGKVATQTIEDDWEGFFIGSRDPFPARHDLKGLDTIRSWGEFFAVAGISLGMWGLIIGAYIFVMHAFTAAHPTPSFRSTKPTSTRPSRADPT